VNTRDKVAAGTFYADYGNNTIYLGDNPANYILDSLAAERFQKFGQWFSAAEWQRAGHDAGSHFTIG
jgi:hypothetical protein